MLRSLGAADGAIVQVSAESEPDLFWAMRGGEGNFGVATRLQLRLHEISEIVGGIVILPATPEVITGFIEAADAAPEEVSTIANVMLAPPTLVSVVAVMRKLLHAIYGMLRTDSDFDGEKFRRSVRAPA